MVCPDGGQLRQSQVGEVDGACAELLEEVPPDGWWQVVFPAKEGVFALQVAVVIVDRIAVEHAGLAEEECLDLEEAVALTAYAFGGQVGGEPLEGVAVGAEAKVAGEGDVKRLVPIVVCASEAVDDIVCFTLEAFAEQGSHPESDLEGIDVAEAREAGRGLVAG